MKKVHLFGILVIAVAIMVIISTAGDASSYVNFSEAKEMFDNGKTTKIHVVGELPKDAAGQVRGIERSEDNLSFSFILVDENQKEQRVYYNEPVPADFTMAEQVVVIGGYRNQETFIADKILMKCPSKYQETEIK